MTLIFVNAAQLNKHEKSRSNRERVVEHMFFTHLNVLEQFQVVLLDRRRNQLRQQIDPLKFQEEVHP